MGRGVAARGTSPRHTVTAVDAVGRFDVSSLVARAKEGRVAKAEIAEVARRLAAGAEGEDTYSLLYVVGRSFAVEHEGLVAGFLESRDEPTLARLAVQVLCTQWRLTERYVDQLQRFLDGVDWDCLDDVRPVAVTAAGEFLREHAHRGLLERLVHLCGPAGLDPLQRRIAREALARALGDPAPADVLPMARARLAAQGG